MFPERCSYCGRSAAVSSSYLSLPTSSTAEEIGFIMEQTQRIDEAISAFHATRVRLLRRLNELQSPTSNLPPEILSAVFSHVTPPVDFGPFDFVWKESEDIREVHRQVLLGAVSSYWRQVVFSTPRLWATALISIKLKTLGLKVNLLELYLENVQGVPFSLELHIDRYGAVEEHFDPLLRTIQKGGQAFMLLSLSRPPKGWFPMLSSHLPNLEDLRLRWGSLGVADSAPTSSQISHPISNLRSLQRMFIWQFSIGYLPSDQPCHNITVLHLSDVPRNTCVQLLRFCPNLVEYRYMRFYPEYNPPPFEEGHITLHNLQLFQMVNPSFSVVLPFLHFPVLRQL